MTAVLTLPDHTQLPVSDRDFGTKWAEQQLTMPDHTQLPTSGGGFAQSFHEHPQSMALTLSIRPMLDQLHTDGQYAIGQDSGIYWRLTDPPQRGAVAPDWFYVPNVAPLIDGKVRRSYVMWQELIAPLIVIEFVSEDGREERDATPMSGKFWVYEQVIRPPFYGIYEVSRANIDLYHLVEGRYALVQPNERGHVPITPLGVELGIWPGVYQNQDLPWLRWWDANGVLLLTGEERAEQEAARAEQEAARAEQEAARAEQEAARAEQEAARAEQEAARAERLAAQLRALGIEPEA
jgi:Uma2 family endonuclease